MMLTRMDLHHRNPDHRLVTPTRTSGKKRKEILMFNWVAIQQQPLQKSIDTKTLITSYKRGKSLKDTLVRAKS